MSELNHELFNLAMSAEAQPLMDAVKRHIAENVEPVREEFDTLHKQRPGHWEWHPRQLELLDGAKQKARAVYASRQVLLLAMQNSLSAGWLRIYRTGIEPAGMR